MSAVECRYGQKVDNREVQTEQCRKVQQRHNPHLRNLARHLCHANRTGELRAGQFENDPIECIHHHRNDHRRALERHRDGLDESGIRALIGIHDADNTTVMRRIVMRGDTDREFLPVTIHLHRHRDSTVIRTNHIHHLLPRFNRLPVNCDNAVIRHQSCIRRRVVSKHRAKDGRGVWRLHACKEENAEEEHHRQNEVHRRARQNHYHA